MSKTLVSLNLEDDVIHALDEHASMVGLSRSAFVNLICGAACEVYPAGDVFGTILQGAKQNAADGEHQEVMQTA